MVWVLMARAVAGGDVTISSMTVNEVEARDVVCHLDGFDLGWMFKFQAAIGESKAKGDACVTEGRAIRLQWDWSSDSKTPTVLATNATAKEQKCLVKVLSVPAELQARCEATLLYGEMLPARSAADALKKEPAPTKEPAPAN